MGSVKLPHQRRVQNQGPRDPRPLLWSIPLPIDQVLQPPAPAANIQELAHFKCRMIINEPGGRRGNGWRAKDTVVDRLQLGHMERGVDTKGVGELKADSRGVNHFDNLKRANVTGCQLPRIGLEWNIF